MGKRNDRALRFYNEVLDLDRLHYGLWLDEDELSLNNLKAAQLRYEDFLIKKIPDNVSKILDVGCGTGILTKRLLELGYNMEGLSPDITQMKNFTENIKAPFHHMKFNELQISNTYDCLIMSESAQYIHLHDLFSNAERSLKDDGFLMICDYFAKSDATGKQGKSGHKIDVFNKMINESKFKIIEEIDITENVLKTLDLAKYAVDKVYKAVDIGTEKVRSDYPRVTKFVLWLFRNKIAKLERQLLLINSDEFRKNKVYSFFLLQLKN